MSESSAPQKKAKDVTLEDLRRCTEIFETLVEDPLLLTKLSSEERTRLLIAVGRAVKPDQIEIRKRVRAIRNARNQERRTADAVARSQTVIRKVREQSVYVAPARLALAVAPTERDGGKATAQRTLQNPDHCYICKQEFTDVHHFYDSLCPDCAALNYEKRFQTADLSGQIAVITGARLKIGYQAALMMLRAGASVVVTTRFPVDAARRYCKEADFSEWGQRLMIYGLDLRHSPSVETFADALGRRLGRLDILINNAAQTVRRPAGFYRHLIDAERAEFVTLPERERSVLSHYHQLLAELSSGLTSTDPSEERTAWLAEWHSAKKEQRLPQALGLTSAPELSMIPYAFDTDSAKESELFPVGKLDQDLQQVDLRKMNSWRMTLADVPTAELLEVQLINSIAPFILCAKLKPLMMKDRTDKKHVVNVSAMEGKFNRGTKTDKHPHTNMAKAALNMMTLTSARDYANCGIFMNAVDTGWVTDEDPVELSAKKQLDHDFQPPLDIVDGAARVLDPVFSGANSGQHSWGNFLKDYRPTSW
jgi:NAD(P)-dependent dehydrogenase (short-subunit alcohol dehydrogenase family)